MTNYFKVLEEESIRDNFVVIYELLDEMMDNGYVQTTDKNLLQEIIKTEKYELELDEKPKVSVGNDVEISKQFTNSTPWRKPGIKYVKNDVYLDVIEKVNMVVSHAGCF